MQKYQKKSKTRHDIKVIIVWFLQILFIGL